MAALKLTQIKVSADKEAGKKLADACAACHGEDGNSTIPKFSIPAGQSANYLASALRVYHTGARGFSIKHVMSFPLGAADFRSLVAYYAYSRRQ